MEEEEGVEREGEEKEAIIWLKRGERQLLGDTG